VLRSQGKLDFDQPLVSYVDGLPDAAARPVTIRQVPSHSSGFPNWRTSHPASDASNALPALVTAFTPGTRFQYSGEGFFYLQRILEQVCGAGIGQVLRNLVFQPLGMNSSSMIRDPGTLTRTALPHNSHGELRKGGDKSDRALRPTQSESVKPSPSSGTKITPPSLANPAIPSCRPG
jgi:CubicO group peptidase (beta-lactamase class C family)